MERAAKPAVESGSGGDAHELIHPLVQVLAEAEQRGLFVLFTAAPIFNSVSIRMIRRVGDEKRTYQRFVRGDQLEAHGTDALAYMLQTMILEDQRL